MVHPNEQKNIRLNYIKYLLQYFSNYAHKNLQQISYPKLQSTEANKLL
jgi:hypothetical protein